MHRHRRAAIMKPTLTTLLLLLLATSCADSVARGPDANLPATRGVSPSAEPLLKTALERIRQNASPTRCLAHLKSISANNRLAGSAESRLAALYVQQQFLLHGLSTRIEEHEVLLPWPTEATVEMIAPFAWKATLSEQTLPDEIDAPQSALPLPLLAFSPDTDVTGRVVYLNRGLEADYAALAPLKLNLRGAIGVVRYGGSYRGTKVRLAAEHGLAALLLYCDPQDDGWVRGDVWPLGPWRPPQSLQRGSALDIGTIMGDPLTPGVAALPGAQRINLQEAPGIPAIAGIALNATDAGTLLAALGGPAVPAGFQGALPFTYHVGGDAKVTLRLTARSDWQTRTIQNVIAEVRGTLDPQSSIMLCAHRDAWGQGGADNAAGTATLLECAELIGRLNTQGLRPARSITFCSFDAEEFGIIGSAEYAEAHERALHGGQALCINLDACVTGPEFSVSGAPETGHFVRTALAGRNDGATWKPRMQGGGSDFAPFLQRFGTPALSVNSEGPYGVYHSAYDTYAWMKRFGDPEGRNMSAVACASACIAWAAADSTLLAVDVLAHADWIATEVRSVSTGLSAAEQTELQTAVAVLQSAATVLAARIASASASDPDPTRLIGANRLLATLPRALLQTDMEAGRPGYRHVLVGVDPADGYSALSLPTLRAAQKLAPGPARQRAVEIVLHTLQRAAAAQQQAAFAIERALR
ncbi:MAG: M28 family peptidase [Planctomycetes bacterium]|nr:M28 family peptidase [Planctomycetota bacterium]